MPDPVFGIGAEPLKRQAALQRLAEARIMAIVRTSNPESAVWASQLLIECGFRAIEIPFTVPDAPDVIEALALDHSEALIGAGTVLDLETCYQALSAGAEFVVSPALVETVVQFGLDEDVLVLPGCMTPTEMLKAHQLGAPAIKFFPAQCAGGADFIRALQGPLPQIPVVPTGGIQLEHMRDYLNAGVLAVGVGGPLLPASLVVRRDEAMLRELAAAYLNAVKTPNQ